MLPLFAALVVYGSVKNSGGVGSKGVETNQVFNRAERVDRVDGDESGLNAENAEAQRGEGGNFSRASCPKLNASSESCCKWTPDFISHLYRGAVCIYISRMI